MEKKIQKTYMIVLLALVCCGLWGSAFPFIKLGYAEFQIDAGDPPSQILFAGVRFTLAGILAWFFGSALEKKPLLPKKGSLKKIAVLSLFQTILQYLFFYMGLANCSGVKSSVIEGLSTFLTIIITALIFRMEKLTAPKIVGCILGIAGVVIVNLGGDFSGGFALNGEGFLVLSQLSYALSTIFIKINTKDENPVTLSSLQFVAGGLVLTAAGLAFGGRITAVSANGVWILVYLAFVSAVAYTLWSLLLKYNPVSRVAVYGFFTPICGVLLSAVFLGETEQAFRINSIIALALVCVGIYAVNREWSKSPFESE